MKKIFYGWWIVLAGFLIAFYVSSVIFYGFTAFFEPLIKEFGWSYTQVSFAASLRGLEMGIFAPVVGFLVDRFGSRKLIFCGAIMVGVGLILLSLTRSLTMFYIAFLILSFGGGGCTSVVTMSAVANWFEKDVGKAFGLMASGFGASGLFIPLIVWLISAYGWRTTLVILGLGMWVMGIPLSFVIRDKPEKYGYKMDGGAAIRPSPANKTVQAKAEMTFRMAIRHKTFLYLSITELVRMIAVTAVITHIMPYLGSLGISRSTAGLVAAAVPLWSIIGRLGFGWLADIFEKRYVMASAFCLMTIGMLAFSFGHLHWMILPFLFFFPPSMGGSMVLRGAVLRENFGRGSFGKMLGIVMGAGSIGGIIGPTVAGLGYDILGSYQSVWLLFAGLIGLNIFLVSRFERVKKLAS
jgi:MFS transporter, OFA family, oxalate/formate antiporter